MADGTGSDTTDTPKAKRTRKVAPLVVVHLGENGDDGLTIITADMNITTEARVRQFITASDLFGDFEVRPQSKAKVITRERKEVGRWS